MNFWIYLPQRTVEAEPLNIFRAVKAESLYLLKAEVGRFPIFLGVKYYGERTKQLNLRSRTDQP